MEVYGSMKSRKVCSKSGETSRKSHVKMYKSGKHWVRVVMTRIGLIRLFKGRKEEIRISLSDEAMGEPTLSYNILKGAAALSTIMAGGAGSQTVFADDTTAVELELSTETLVDSDVVSMGQDDSALDETQSVLEESLSLLSRSESLSSLHSLSESQSLSAFTSESMSESVSESVSESISESYSQSESISSSESHSQSELKSTSHLSSTSETSTSSELTTSESSAKESQSEASVDTTDLIKAKEELELATIVSDIKSEFLTGEALASYQAKVAEAKALYTIWMRTRFIERLRCWTMWKRSRTIWACGNSFLAS